MNSICTCKLAGVLALAILAVCFNAGRVSAQDFHGKFTLPVEARWGPVTLPPGEYSIIVDHQPVLGKVFLSGTRKNAIIAPTIIDHLDVPKHTGLICEWSSGRFNVRSLYVEELNLVLSYPRPKGERQLMAQAPRATERVRIAAVK